MDGNMLCKWPSSLQMWTLTMIIQCTAAAGEPSGLAPGNPLQDQGGRSPLLALGGSERQCTPMGWAC